MSTQDIHQDNFYRPDIKRNSIQMIVRMLLDGLLSLGRPARPATMRTPWTKITPHDRRRQEPSSPFRGRPDLMLVTGAMSAPTAIPPRMVRGRYGAAGTHRAA